MALAQGNYEIQVYGAELVAPKSTMVELHSNYTFNGAPAIVNGVFSDNHSFHETVEITHGFSPWLEVGFYLFNALGATPGAQYVGSHIRPRVSLPETMHFPVGLSLSLEAGWQKTTFSDDYWTLEIRPIIDKKWNKWYVSFNPVFDRSFRGLNAGRGLIFSPNFKASYDLTEKFAPGVEYYGSVGPLNHIDPYSDQNHQLFLSLDLNVLKDWEFNAGVGYFFVPDRGAIIIKTIVGKRF